MQQDILTIFIVEDDLFYGSMLEHLLALNPEYEVRKFTSAEAFKQALHEKPHVVTLDYSFPDTTGEALLATIREISPDTKTIMISGQEDIQVAIDMMKKGAYDYIVKNDEAKDRLWITLQNLREHFTLQRQLNSLKDEVAKKYAFKSIIGTSPAIKKVFDLVEKAARTNITAIITGETGTGKELVAKAIHFNSPRKAKPFVAVNIAAVPGDLIESELFGHEKGAFTGAVARRIGKFEEAHKGTLFLDEVGELNINLQAKLLRVLQEKEFSRLGSNDIIQTDVRIIVATHRNLAQEVKRGKFREDLYYRLLGLPIHLPPLRERGNDILLIAKFFIDQFCRENDMPFKKLTVEAKMKLMTFGFPGNIRQLKSMMELACVLSDGEDITPAHIDTGNHSLPDIATGDHLTLKQYTTRIIQQYLDNHDADVLKVAALLDVGKSTIYRMISKNELVLHKNKTN